MSNPISMIILITKLHSTFYNQITTVYGIHILKSYPLSVIYLQSKLIVLNEKDINILS